MINYRLTEIQEFANAPTNKTPSATSPVTITTTATLILDTNTLRKHCIIQNVNTTAYKIRLGSIPTTTSYDLIIGGDSGSEEGRGGVLNLEQYQGEIYGIVDSGTTVIAVIYICM